MVFLTNVVCSYIPKWLPRTRNLATNKMKRLMMFKLTWNFYGRNKNCYNFARNYWFKHQQGQVKTRHKFKEEMYDLSRQRIDAACLEHNFCYRDLMKNLPKTGIALNHQVLAQLAIWEPRSFKSIVELAKVVNLERGRHEAARRTVVSPGVIIDKSIIIKD